jgi:hypothetical protein
MKKIITIVFLLFSMTFAGTGWFDDYITVSGTQYYIVGSGTEFNGANLGNSVTSLNITAADFKYWSDTQDRIGGAFYWQIKDQNNTNVISGPYEVIWTQTKLAATNDYQGTWSGSINVLNGLEGNKTYKLHIWAKSWSGSGGQGDSWLSNNNNNYVATFTTNSSVPVELTSFSALLKGKDVKLNWQTATEVNNYGFEILRLAQNDKDSWVKIGFVNGHGNSNSTKNYSFIDKDVSNGSYNYRLKQIDSDGKYEYSPTVEVTVNNVPRQFELSQNYPNPFNPSTIISYSLPSKEFVQLRVFNVLGNEIITLVNEVQEAGNYKVEFNASKVNVSTSGVYFYRLEAGSFIDSRKMTLVK